MKDRFSSFSKFYPYYLAEHSKKGTKILHFIGTSLVICFLSIFCFTQKISWLLLCPVLGYGFAWTGHYFIENNKPATFRYPLYSLIGDFLMFWQILSGKIKII